MLHPTPAGAQERYTLLDDLDARQNELLDQLDALNQRLEAVLATLQPKTPEAVPLPRAA